ncbi:MAG TPA: hypothetical protein VEU33_19905 [Archangium sp.]|nr:hypothetical protein [Archangium sp.]
MPWLPGQDEAPVVGRARVVTAAPPSEQGTQRVSFTFVDVSDEDHERLEMLLFDLALGYIVA